MNRGPESFVGEVLDRLGDPKHVGVPVVGYDVRTVVRKSGWKSRSRRRMETLQEMLASVEITTSERLTNLGLPLGRRVYFSTGKLHPAPAIEASGRAREKLVEMAISQHLDLIESAIPDLSEIVLAAGGTKQKRSLVLHGRRYRPDLILRTGDRLVAVEIEADRPKYESVTQLDGYVRAMQAHNPPRARTSGMLITYPPRHDAESKTTQQRLATIRRMTGAGEIYWLWLVAFEEGIPQLALPQPYA